MYWLGFIPSGGRSFVIQRNRGQGSLIDLKKAGKLANKFPILLAGGLNPKNVKSSVALAGKICGVDVAGGVETKGQKDSSKIKAFIHRAKLST